MPFNAMRAAMSGAKAKPTNAPAGRGGISNVKRQAMSQGTGVGPSPQMLQQSQIPPMSPAPQPSDSMPMDQSMQPNPFQANPFSATGIIPPQQSGMTGTGQSPIPSPSPMMGGGPQTMPKPMMGPMMGGGPQTAPKPQGMGIGPSMMQPAQGMRPAMRRGMRQ